MKPSAPRALQGTALLWCGLLAACAAPPQPPATVAPATPAQWHAPLPHGGALTTLRDWWQRLDDPLLVSLIDAAQAVSPSLAEAQARIAQARATRAAAQAALSPSLDAQAAAQRSNTQLQAVLTSTVQAGLQTQWELDLFGGNRAQAQAALARLDGAQADWHAARVAVAAETAAQYFSLRHCERLLDVARRDAASRAETARLTQLSTSAGFTAPGVAALARASAAEGSARATQQQAQCDADLKVLVALTGLGEPALRERLAQTPPAPVPATLFGVAALPAQVLAQRPDLYRAERAVAAASAEVASTRAQQMPRVSLSGAIAVGHIRTGGAGSDAQTWSIGPLAVTLPLLDGGTRAANTSAAEARYAQAVAAYQASVRQAVSEVEQALVNLAASNARTRDADVATEGYRAAFAATDARWRAGLASLMELEDARRTSLAAENALVALSRERLLAWVALYRAAGGGWERPAEATAQATPGTTP